MKKIIDISDAQVSNDPQDVLATYSLGSCIGVSLYDSALKIGGMLHYQLPTATMDAAKAQKNPLMFADTGMQYLLQKLVNLGASPKRLQVKIAGGAQMMNDNTLFNIGKRNHAALRQILWKNGLFLAAEDVGGQKARNLYLYLDSGRVEVKCQGETRIL